MSEGMYQTFEDLRGDEDQGAQSAYVPFAFREDESDEGTLKWLNDNFDYLFDNSKERLFAYSRLSSRFKGLRKDRTIRESLRDHSETNTKVKVHTNFFQNLTDKRVSQLAQLPINMTFIPQDDTKQGDIDDSNSCELLVRHRMNEIEFSNLNSEIDQMTFKYGTSFTKVFWNKDIGPISKEFKEAKKTYGEKITATHASARIGDVEVKIIDAGKLFIERKKVRWEDVDFVDEIEFVHKQELIQCYENSEIKKEAYIWPDFEGDESNSSDYIAVHHFYHKPTKYLPNGCYIKYIESGILEWCKEYDDVMKHMPHMGLPYIPDWDIKFDNDIWGRSFFQNIEQKNNVYDLIEQGTIRNIGVASAPKLLVPENSINLKQWNNDFGHVQFKGAPPQWLKFDYVNLGEQAIQDRQIKIMNDFSKISELAVNPTQFKDMPASGLRLLEDTAQGLNTLTINRKKKRTREIYWQVAMMMGQHYKDNDGRIVSIIGDDNEYMIKAFKKMPMFSKLSSIQVEQTSALSSTRAGRVADIIELNQANQKDPAFGRKEIISMLNMGTDKAFREEIASGVIVGRKLLEMLKNGDTPPAPTEEDDLISIYMIFIRFIEGVSFKMKLDEKKKSMIRDYIMGIEGLMAMQAQQNALFAMKVKEIDKYPVYFKAGMEITKPQQPTPPQAPAKQSDKPLNQVAERAQDSEKQVINNRKGVN